MDSRIQELQNLLEDEKPMHGDVIVWLQGDQYDRGRKVLELYRQGFAPNILITGNNVLIGKNTRPEEENISLGEMKQWLLDEGVKEAHIIVDDGPLNTREQAEHVIGLAIENNWNRILVVSSIHYHLRVFLTFLKYMKEVGWKGRIINQMAKLRWDEVPGGRVKTAREYFTEEIEKIKRYTDHVALPEEGIEYLVHN